MDNPKIQICGLGIEGEVGGGERREGKGFEREEGAMLEVFNCFACL